MTRPTKWKVSDAVPWWIVTDDGAEIPTILGSFFDPQIAREVVKLHNELVQKQLEFPREY